MKNGIEAKLIIRPEQAEDFPGIRDTLKQAFNRPGKDPSFNEWLLVEHIRRSPFYLPGLALVAKYENEIVGHIIFTPMMVENGKNAYETLALGPIAVAPRFQKRGIGRGLIEDGLGRAKKLGYRSVIVLGDPNYYLRFGFEKAGRWGIGLNDNFACDFLFALELVEDGLKGVEGNVRYCDPFYNANGDLI